MNRGERPAVNAKRVEREAPPKMTRIRCRFEVDIRH